jgi:hypothetical protein
MANETTNTTIETTAPVDGGFQEYIDQINELKRNTVSREAYDRIKEENRTLLSNIVSGAGVKQDAENAEPVISTSDLIKNTYLHNNMGSDIATVKNMLEIRERLMANGGRDPWVGGGNNLIASDKQYQPTQADYAEAERQAEALKHCLEMANGDEALFHQFIVRTFA